MATKESLEPALNNFAEVARRYCDWVEGEFRDPRQALREAPPVVSGVAVGGGKVTDH